MTQARDDTPPSEKQIAYLRDLGYQGAIPATRREVSYLIDDLLEDIPPTDKQLEYLDSLGYDGPEPVSKPAASALIDRLKEAA